MAVILWVEDQLHWIERFRPVLEETAFDAAPTEVQVFKFAEAACQHIRQVGDDGAPDLALLDANMNGNDAAGFSVSRALQRKWPDLPIIYLSEHSGTGIEEQAFETSGARDFIAKHQRNVEQVLCWRIKAALRQSDMRQPGPAQSGDVLQSGELSLDTVTWEVYWRGSKLMNPANAKRPLAPMPRKILRYLVEASPRAVTTEQMAEHLDTDTARFSYASYRQHIRTLRRAFDQAMGGDGRFQAICDGGEGIVTFGDEGAYCWRPVKGAET
ncbi:response regulator transcription factor [Aquisalimonas asiatica]|uniref:DNA-binding response regulator, OmpR family, contains REC and winged-helix (WHTH) domain n=1 Tax=Aquisalimonas asiatica TaxID=406100 RepID=A0A1H8PYN3_9GAMM|nr:response regulator [Aquisalimonas asiatica]SEO46861.1 DNA-binding response regulator, OmpR family, contains REC and winged-helix (wHTH) domain [Aquisalimonas asiatica]